MNAYEQKQEARRERYLEHAEKAEGRSRDAWAQSDRCVEGIPPGQPILVGHHSEGRHRRAIEKCHKAMGRGLAEQSKASHYEHKAEAVGRGGISSDDPDAVTKLREKKAKLERKRDDMKLGNKAYRFALKCGVNGQGADTPTETRELIAKGSGMTDKYYTLILDHVLAWTPPYSFVTRPWEGYTLTNTGAEIRRLEKRIKALELAPTESSESTVGDVRIVRNAEANRLQIFFPGKPSEEVRTSLKRHGFRWSRYGGAWQRHLTERAAYLAQSIVGEAN